MRKTYIDILKGISILAIMLLHFENGIFLSAVNAWIGGFMVNAFFFVSGWLQADHPIELDKTYFQRRWKSLGIPYLAFTLLILVFDLLMALLGEMPLYIFCRDAYKALVLRGIGTLWFIPALWGGEILFACFRKWKLTGKIAILFLTLIVLQGYAWWALRFAHNDGVLWRIWDAPFYALNCCFGAWIIIAGGFYLARFCEKHIFEASLPQKIISAFLLLGWYTLCVNFDFNANFFWMTGIVSSFGLLIFCMVLETLPVMKFFSFWGRNSLILMATHFSIVQELCILINRHCFGGKELLGWRALAFFGIALFLEYPLVWFFNRVCPFMLGKSKQV